METWYEIQKRKRVKVVKYLKEKYRLDWPGVDAHVAIPFSRVASEIKKIESFLDGHLKSLK
jgi:hypothetical protein